MDLGQKRILIFALSVAKDFSKTGKIINSVFFDTILSPDEIDEVYYCGDLIYKRK